METQEILEEAFSEGYRFEKERNTNPANMRGVEKFGEFFGGNIKAKPAAFFRAEVYGLTLYNKLLFIQEFKKGVLARRNA